jgi:hypothetical protein
MSMPTTTKSPLEIVDEVVIAGSPQNRHRSRAGMQLLPNGDLFVAYRVGWDMFEVPHGGVVGTWSKDGGRTWEDPLPLAAEPGWDWFGAQRLCRLDDGSLLMMVGKARWGTDLFLTYSTRSRDGGRTWEEIGPKIAVFASFSEPYGQGVTHGLPDNQIILGFHGSDQPGAPSIAGVAISSDAGRSWSAPVVIASQPEVNFREADLIRLDDGRILTVLRTDQPPYESFQSLSDDNGRAWTPITKTGFKGHCPRLFQLRHGILCVYRDMEPTRPGISYSVTYDNGHMWHDGGSLYASPGAYSGWASACGYPAVVRLPGGEILCVFHTDFVDENSDIRGLLLRDR